MGTVGRWVLICSVWALLAGCSAPPPTRTNFLLIVVDDLGWSDLAAYGNAFHETPRIDALAAEGVRFTDFYAVSPVCTPTRASILTGRHPARLGMTEFNPGQWRPFERLVVPESARDLPGDVPTLGELLGDAGYETAFFGKWHVGRDDGPGDRGFDVSLRVAGEHVAPGIRTRPRTDLPEGTYVADALTDRALRFAERHREDSFFVVVSHLAMHTPLQARREAIDHFDAKSRPPGVQRNARYAAMLAHVDETVGRLRDGLDRLGLADRTVVILTSDNGAVHRHFLGLGDPISSNDPLRGEKGSLYEGGIRVPLIVHWPGRTPEGAEVSQATISMDLFPTLLDIAGVPVPEGDDGDGRSLVPVLEDPTRALEQRPLYFHYPHYHHARPAGAIRSGSLKLVESFDDGSVELYDLAADPGEAHDLATERPQDSERLRGRLAEWRTSVDAPMPRPNPDYDPERADEWWHLGRREPFDLEEEARRLEPWKHR